VFTAAYVERNMHPPTLCCLKKTVRTSGCPNRFSGLLVVVKQAVNKIADNMFEHTLSTISMNKSLSSRVHIRNRIPPEIILFPGTGFTIFSIQNNIKWLVIKD